MPTWSGIRHKLENDYLAQSLRGHIKYYCTSYSKSPDHHGRASIRLDGKELISGCYWNNWSKAHLFPHDETYEKRMTENYAYMDDTALKLGIFSPHAFYQAFEEFDNQIENCYIDKKNVRKLVPGTLEGCVMRISDIIAYLGKDRQDAEKASILKTDAYEECAIGTYNAEIINNLIQRQLWKSKQQM